MTHIDDWLDNPLTGPAEVKEWFEHFRRPAIQKDYKWLNSRKLFCTYKDGNRYRCIGCSRMGDVWLTKHFDRENGYDLRIDIDDCTDWVVTYEGIEVVFTPDMIEAIYAAWHGAGVDIAGGNWDRFVGMLPTSHEIPVGGWTHICRDGKKHTTYEKGCPFSCGAVFKGE